MGTRCSTSPSGPPAGAPTRWVGESGVDQLRVCRLQLDELAEEPVVLGVGHLRRILLVIEPVGAGQHLAQLGGAGGGIVGSGAWWCVHRDRG